MVGRVSSQFGIDGKCFITALQSSHALRVSNKYGKQWLLHEFSNAFLFVTKYIDLSSQQKEIKVLFIIKIIKFFILYFFFIVHRVFHARFYSRTYSYIQLKLLHGL